MSSKCSRFTPHLRDRANGVKCGHYQLCCVSKKESKLNICVREKREQSLVNVVLTPHLPNAANGGKHNLYHTFAFLGKLRKCHLCDIFTAGEKVSQIFVHTLHLLNRTNAKKMRPLPTLSSL